MKPKTIFELCIRILGLVFLYHGVNNVPMVFAGNGYAIVFVIVQFGIAWWLIGGAAPLVNRAYPDLDATPPTNENSGSKPR